MTTKIAKIYVTVIGTILAVGMFLSMAPVLANPNTSPTEVKPATVSLTGTIHELALAGTCYQLATDNGDKYELMGKFPKVNGKRVRVSGVVAADTVTICQVGKPLKVKSVRVIK